MVILAGALRPTSALLKRALADPAAMACISYALDAEKAAPLAAAMARELGVRLDMDAARQLAQAAANDRALMAREVEKLALYLDAAPDRPATADIAALDAIGAGEGEAELSRLVDAVLGGSPGEAAREIAQLSEQGVAGIRSISRGRAWGRRAAVRGRPGSPASCWNVGMAAADTAARSPHGYARRESPFSPPPRSLSSGMLLRMEMPYRMFGP